MKDRGASEVHVTCTCTCGGSVSLASNLADGTAAMFHTMPPCEAFLRDRDPVEYVRELQLLPANKKEGST